MCNARMLFLALALTSSPGCVVVSLHPLWSPEVVVKVDKLEGTWVDFNPHFNQVNSVWVITLGQDGAYEVKFTDGRGEKTETFEALVAKIGEDLYLDIRAKPSKPGLDAIYAHRFLRLKKGRDHLAVQPCNRKKLEALLMKNADVSIAGEAVDIQFVLTSKTPALQAFFKDHGAEVFGPPIILRRKETDVTGPEIQPLNPK